MALEDASAGFRNQGQFIAALNASKNQGVAFVDLKEAMTVDGLSLGQAVKQLRNAPAPVSTPPTGETAGTGTTGTTTTDSASTGTTTGTSTSSGSTTGSGTTSGSGTAPAAQ
jgi:hypothetical protein